ncbi:sialate O-acetylesterase [Pseudoxanthomonas sp.]|uniref:sialate O-acetylesterase n=1 Tax=Pseudoxanthomonas sp. TaxID=1871049 RepID=UPI002633FBAE|nr:sialate O-acetylesterase [Pseudoxanthomonas sp.]WDS37787.1 MAG: sialate O-acetylesterase [Pseudoxanthomonas sp.]
MLSSVVQAAWAGILLGAPFTEHAVFQRDQPIPIWGTATPGAQVTVRFAEQVTRVHAASNGDWRAALPSQPAGGPFTLDVSAGQDQLHLDDVLVGDVWLCGGQSNMEFPVERALDANAEIAAAADPLIRLMRVPKGSSETPRSTFDVPAVWASATPESVRSFSAVCWYFARELHRDMAVPLGLINASWNGSRIEAWTSPSALRAAGGADAGLDLLDLHARDPDAAVQPWISMWEAWWRGRPRQQPGDLPWRSRDTGHWVSARPSSQWVAPALVDHVGLSWYRTTVDLTAAQAKQSATLELGRVDEVDTAWVNGAGVGTTYGSGVERRYAIATGSLQAGSNAIVLNVLNTYRQGGITGPAAGRALVLADGTRIGLDADWQVRAEDPDAGMPPAAPWMPAFGFGTLHNGMMAPLGGYGLRGAVWYQGESNAHEPARYARRLTTWRDDLRAQFGPALPLLVVQLAGYGALASAPATSNWAELREAQRQVVAADPHAALAVTVDLGEVGDIHPANKQEVGRRLARAARAEVYGVASSSSGPVALRAWHAGPDVLVRFGGIDGALVAQGGPDVLGFELCGEVQASCRYAHAVVEGDQVRLQGERASEATRVRYAWADNPLVNLYDSAALPAGPFELPIR